MATNYKGKSVVVEDETYKLTSLDIEFLLNIIENSMVLEEVYRFRCSNTEITKPIRMVDRNQLELNQRPTNWKEKPIKPKGKPTIRKEGDEVWIEEKK